MNAQRAQLGSLQYGIIFLTVTTAIIHLGLAFLDLPLPMRILFILNGIGYLGLVAGLYLSIPALARYRNGLRWLLIGYAAVTIAAWLILNGNFSDPASLVTKVIEVALIILLVVEWRRA